MQKNNKSYPMYTRLLIVLFLGFLYPTSLISQSCPNFYLKGIMYNIADNTQSNICYKRGTIVEVDPDVYHTNYTIVNTNGKELYNIHLYFYKSLDSISVVYFNIPSGITSTKPLTFEEHSSIRMFKNYKANDMGISTDIRNCTLFTIPEPTRPYIILNQFQLLDEETTYLSLDPVNTDKLQQYLNEVQIYKKWKDSVDFALKQEQKKIEDHKKAISNMLNEMKEYKNNEINRILYEEEEFKKEGIYEAADPNLSEKFKTEMNHIFRNYYKNIFQCEDSYSEMSFTFFMDSDGSIDPSKTLIHSINSNKLQWIQDSFLLNIEPQIFRMTFKTRVISKYNPNLITDFNLRFVNAFNFLEPSADERREFNSTKTAIYNDLEKYMTRDLSSRTKYSYVIRYKSTVENVDWIYERDRKGIEKLGPKGYEQTISQELKDIFKQKIAKPDVGKYRIKICKIFLNDEPVGQDIRSN